MSTAEGQNERPVSPPEAIEASRGSRLSPLSLGILSLFDPSLIATVLTFVRARSELRAVAAREARDIFDHEHARVRSSAVWGSALASGRLFAAALVALFFFAPSGARPERAPAPPTYASFGGDETSELGARMLSTDADARALATRHILERGWYLPYDEVAQVLDDPTTSPGERSFLVQVTSLPSRRSISVARLQRLYPTLDPPGRAAALRILLAEADRGWSQTSRAREAFWTLVEAERTAHPELRLPITHRARGDDFLERLLHLPPGSPFAPDVLRIIAPLFCPAPYEVRHVQSHSPELVTAARERARSRWAELRPMLDSPPPHPGVRGHLVRTLQAEEAVAALEVLRCDDPAELASAHEALGSADPRVVLAGAERLMAQRRAVSGDVLERLAREPLVAVLLYHLQIRHHARRLPLEDALASHVARQLAEQGFAATSVTPRGAPIRVERPREGREREVAALLAALDEEGGTHYLVRVFDVEGFDRQGRSAIATAVMPTFVVSPSTEEVSGLAILHGPQDAPRIEAIVDTFALFALRSLR